MSDPDAVERARLERRYERERGARQEAEAIAEAATLRLYRLTEELERSNRDLELFAYAASHDLREPLRAIIAYTQLLAERYRGRLDEDADTFIEFAVDGAVRMETLIDDLLAYARLGGTLELERTDLGTCADRAIANLQTAVDAAGATVRRGPLPTLVVDGGQLVQLFQNLVANAIEFRATAPPVVDIHGERDGSAWRFAVRDNGLGIEPEFRERIFGLFQHLHTRDRYRGNGIGLALCERIVERHHGRIWVESEPGTGSTFLFTLPAEDD